MSNKIRLGLNYEQPIFYDLETSGLDPAVHQIIQIAAIHLPSGDTFESKVKFDLERASKEALEINHYNADNWWQAITQEQAATAFNQFCADHTSVVRKSKKSGKPYSSACLIGYNNAHFDQNFIDRLIDGQKLFAKYDYRQLDVHALAKWQLPWLDDYSLTAMRDYFDLPVRNAHDALEDVKMTIDVAACLIEIMAESKTFEMPGWASHRLECFDEIKKLDAEDDIPF